MALPAEIKLQIALEQNEIVPYFQPLINLRTRELKGFEVLARWIQSSGQLVTPDEFLPLAEASGLIELLTRNLLAATFAAAATIPEHLTFSVNISPPQLQDDSLPEQIVLLASAANFSLDRLVLEITERTISSNFTVAYSTVHKLKSLGLRLSLDDFGTGYSGLRRLQVFPFDEIKIDATFVRSITESVKSRQIVAATIGLGRSLDLITVAESVETEPQADLLADLGCDLAQGWLFGSEVPAESLSATVSATKAVSQNAIGFADSICTG